MAIALLTGNTKKVHIYATGWNGAEVAGVPWTAVSSDTNVLTLSAASGTTPGLPTVTGVAVGSATVTVVIDGYITRTLTYGVTSSGGGSVAPTISSLSIDIASSSGGAGVVATGTGFDSSTTVTVGGTAAANVTLVSSTQLYFQTPAKSGAAGGTAYNVVVTNPAGSATLTNGLTVHPAATTTYDSVDFESGTMPGGHWSVYPTDSTTIQSGGGLVSGSTKYLRGLNNGSDATFGALFCTRNSGTRFMPSISANGVYQRWYMRTDQTTLNRVIAGGQIKLHLYRGIHHPADNYTWGGWMIGIGQEFTGSIRNVGGVNKVFFTAYVDNGIYAVESTPSSSNVFGTSATDVEVVAGQVYELMTLYTWDSVANYGTGYFFIDRKLKCRVKAPSMLGPFGTPADYVNDDDEFGCGLRYTQNTSATDLRIDVDDVWLKNGLVDNPTTIP